MSLIIGDAAPDFSLINQFGETITLSEFRGKKPVVIVFYPLSFSGICTGELCELRDDISKFERAGVELLAISVDSKFVQKKFAEQEGYNFSVWQIFGRTVASRRPMTCFLKRQEYLTAQPRGRQSWKHRSQVHHRARSGS